MSGGSRHLPGWAGHCFVPGMSTVRCECGGMQGRNRKGAVLTVRIVIKCPQTACGPGLVGHGEPRSDAEQKNGCPDLWEYLRWL